MKLTVVAAIIVAIATLTTTATAGLVKPIPWGASKAKQLQAVNINLLHTRYICDEGTGHVKRVHCKATRWLLRVKKELTAPRYSIPHRADWLCIHSHEGSWTDSGDPFWGGLQMDKSFMRTYAPGWLLAKGWANSWTPIQQMWVAERALPSRGFYPWPNTARMCGLI